MLTILYFLSKKNYRKIVFALWNQTLSREELQHQALSNADYDFDEALRILIQNNIIVEELEDQIPQYKLNKKKMSRYIKFVTSTGISIFFFMISKIVNASDTYAQKKRQQIVDDFLHSSIK